MPDLLARPQPAARRGFPPPRPTLWPAALIGALATAGLIGWLYAAHQIAHGVPFIPFDITDLVIRLTPAAAATAGIEWLGHWARSILRWVGMLAMIGTGAGLAALAAGLRQRLAGRLRVVGLAIVVLLLSWAVRAAVGPQLPSEPLGVLVLALSYVVWAAAAVWAADRLGDGLAPAGGLGNAPPARRRFLAGFGAAMLGLAAGGFALGQRLRPIPPAIALPDLPPAPLPAAPFPLLSPAAQESAAGAPAPLAATQPAPPPAMPALRPLALTPAATAAFTPAPRTRPNITPLPDFFVVNIGAETPRVDLARWRLEVKGLVEQPLALTFDDLLALPRVDAYGTLECISNEIAGPLIGTTLFSAARMADVLRLARPQAGVEEVVLRAVDRYSESMPLAKALHEDTLLVYGMDGKLLTPDHGYPLRVFNPNHYGMKGPKWLTTLELVAEPYLGYWPRLGWDKEAVVKTTSVIDGAGSLRAENGAAQLGGIAFAGWRGIQEVAVQIDGGEFRPALLDQPLSGLTWVRWRYDWLNPPPGSHQIVVRAVDGNGEVQTPQPAPPHPDGASGWHKVYVVI